MTNEELKHYGIPGMKWGVRRYQNEDGSLTPLGKRRKGEEIDAVNAHYDSIFGGQKKLNKKRIAKLKNKLKNPNRNKNKDEKIKSKIKDRERRIKLANDLAKAEIKKIKNTPISDLMKTRANQRGKSMAMSMIATAAGLTIPHMMGLPYGMVSMYRSNNNYLSSDEIYKVAKKNGFDPSSYNDRSYINKMSFRGTNRKTKKN